MLNTNQLKYSKSPYLQQHAHNPVNWQMWSNEVLQYANENDKPILVSIGYSSCHWCHVMEKESFEDPEVAEIMNKNFINIKIDREEQPEVDAIYMDALQAMTGSGGWPLNVFLTPNLKPFYGGTYFPPIAAHGRLSWIETLNLVVSAFQNRRNEIEEQASKLTNHLTNSNNLFFQLSKQNNFTEENILEKIASNLLKNADEVNGGFGTAPKFPQTFSIQYLLNYFQVFKDEKLLQQANLSLQKMIFGGIYDHIGGGFARYSTDEKWFAPHFEKMLYDNALIVSILCDAYSITKNELYLDTVNETLSFVQRELMSKDYGFYCALDADSEGVEGKYYTWKKDEIQAVLQDDAELFCKIYNVESSGNWEETNILFLNDSIEEIAKQQKIDLQELKVKINDCKSKLLAHREKRKKPLLDNKILCSWNALMNIAFSKAYLVTKNEEYKLLAIKNYEFIKRSFFTENKLYRCFKEKAYNDACLDDYSYLSYCLIELHKITCNSSYIIDCKNLVDIVDDQFSDNHNVYFNYTSNNQDNLIVQKVEIYDGAIPSTNAVMASVLNYLSYVYKKVEWQNRANQMIKLLTKAIVQYPTSFGLWANIILKQNTKQKQVNIVYNYENDVVHFNELFSSYQHNTVIFATNQKNKGFFPTTKDVADSTETVFSLCVNENCYLPETNFEKFLHFYNI